MSLKSAILGCLFIVLSFVACTDKGSNPRVAGLAPNPGGTAGSEGDVSGKPQLTKTARQAFIDQVQKSVRTGFLPTVGYNLRMMDTDWTTAPDAEETYAYVQSKKEGCKVSVDFTGRYMFLQVAGSKENYEYTIPLETSLNTYTLDIFSEGRKLRQVALGYIEQVPLKTGGYRVNNMFAAFDGDKLSHIYLQDMLCEKPNCVGEEPADIRNGVNYICSDNSDLYRPL